MSELLRSLDPCGYLECLEPGVGLVQMRCGSVLVALGMGERRQVEMCPCEVVARLYGVECGKSVLEMHFCLGKVTVGMGDAPERALGETDAPRMVDATSEVASLHGESLGLLQLIVHPIGFPQGTL
jgi:hypothetical protein